jgi:hypothetical protein
MLIQLALLLKSVTDSTGYECAISTLQVIPSVKTYPVVLTNEKYYVQALQSIC